ncbi:MAG: response regulator transcription factor [Chloroflexota bacterium]|nr:response regulator transcription factor [Chloroflexota bacterium]
MPQFQQSRSLSIQRGTLLFRLLAAAIITVASLVLDNPLREPPEWPLYTVVGGYALYSVILDRLLLPRYQNIIVVMFMLLADVVAVLVAFAVVGFSTSNFEALFIVLPLLVIYHSMYLGYLGGLLTATLASVGYAGLIEYANLITWLEVGIDTDPIYVIQIPMLYVIALMTGYLATRRTVSSTGIGQGAIHEDTQAWTTSPLTPVAAQVERHADQGEIARIPETDATLTRIAWTPRTQVRTRLQVGPLDLDPRTEKVTLDRQNVSLSNREFDVLYLLAREPGVPIHQDTLLHGAWGPGFVAQGNVVDVCVHRIRRKLLRAKPWGGQCIQTVRGRGYMVVGIEVDSGT